MNISKTLIIDDEQDICLLLQNFFRKRNAEAVFSLTLKDGLKKFETLKPNLVILDHNLPDGFGIEQISGLKKKDPAISVIVISAMSNLEVKALEHGADFFIAKPISFTQLNTIIAS